MADQELNEQKSMVQVGAAVEEGLTKAMEIAKKYASGEEDPLIRFVAECTLKWKQFQEMYVKLAWSYATLRHFPEDRLHDCLIKMMQARAEQRAEAMAKHRYDNLMAMDM